ncbi:MAG: hypothetical protein K8Q89_10210 [Nitrosarchaeum sp.]|nr:hypothetical protein [Nitrosarchaeum sp.]
MAENKKNISRESIGIASADAPIRAQESVNAPTRQFNGSQDAPTRYSVNAPTNSSKGKTVSSKITAND